MSSISSTVTMMRQAVFDLESCGRALTTRARSSPRREFTRNNNYIVVDSPDLLLLASTAYRLFSTATATASESFSLLNLVKPFLLKCHPDVHQSASAKQINLEAVKNLNSYIDTIEAAVHGKTTNSQSESLIEIDFVILMDPLRSAVKKAQPVPSRRKVELTLPPLHLQHTAPNGKHRLQQHAAREILKLLRVAGLPAPALDLDEIDNSRDVSIYEYLGFGADDDAGAPTTEAAPASMDHPHRRPHFNHMRRPKTRYENNRDKFISKLDWKKYDQMYEEAVADMEADIMTEGSVAKHAHRRRRLIASILANVTLQEEVEVLEQLIAFRRLSLLLEENFEKLHMEDFGRYWETCRIVLGPSRQYNVSASALHKRRQRSGDNGFSFTLHPDNSVSIVVPVDFRDEELIHELETNLWDFYNIVGDGMDDIFAENAM